MKVSIECTYCGHKWEETVYNKSSLVDKTCKNGNCRHSQLIVRDLSSKINYYEGSPEFPPKVEDNGWPYSAGGYGNPLEGMD